MLDAIFAILMHPFVVSMLAFSLVGQFMKGAVFTKQNIMKYKAEKPALGELLWWGRKSMPLHPVLVGLLMGLIPGMPVDPGMENPSIAAVMMFYAAAGVASTWAFDLIKNLARKHGVELTMPGESDRDSRGS